MVTQDTILELFLGGQGLPSTRALELTSVYRLLSFQILRGPEYPGLHVVVGKAGYSRYCGQVATGDKPYPHVKNEFRESLCSCTGTLPNHGVKSWQRASNCGSNGTPPLLPAALRVRSGKSIFSSYGTSTSYDGARRFLRNRNQIEFNFRDHRDRDSNLTVLLAWLRSAVASTATIAISNTTRVSARASSGEVAAITIREILLRRLKGFRTKKFT